MTACPSKISDFVLRSIPIALAISMVGTLFLPARLACASNSPLKDALSSADRITADYVSNGVMYPLVTLTRDRQGSRLALLRNLRPVRIANAMRPSDVTLLVTSRLYPVEKNPILHYSTLTGEIRLGNEHAFAPKEFRVWLRRVYVGTPKRHFRVQRFPHGVVGVTEEYPKLAPLGQVEAFRSREHSLRIMDYQAPHTNEIRQLPLGANGSEVQFAIGDRSPATKLQWKLFRTISTGTQQTFPPSYVGKTIYYRFRWKYEDGIDGPWSKIVSAKVLP